MKSIEFESLLNFLVTEMEKEGLVITNYTFALNKEFVDACNESCGTDSNIDKYRDILQQSITHEYIKNLTMSPLTSLAITQKGVGVVSSNRRANEIRESRTCLKKLSDFINEHNGISNLFAFLFSSISLIISILTFIYKK